MKKTNIMVAFASVMLAGVASTTVAQLPVSRTAGIEQTNLASGFQFVALPFANEPVERGTVTSISTDDLTVDVPAGSFTGLSNAVVQIVSGPSTGIAFEVDEANSSGTTVRATGFSTSAATIDANLTQVQVVEKKTLDSAFPSGGSFTGASSAGNADQLYLIDNSGSLVIVFYNTNTNQWTNTADNSNAGGIGLPINGSVLVNGAATPGSVVASGVAPSNDQSASYLASTFRFIGSPFGSLTLGDLSSQVNAGATAGNADNIYYVDSGNLVIAFRNSSDNTWRNTANNSILADSTAIGTGFLMLGSANGAIEFAEQF